MATCVTSVFHPQFTRTTPAGWDSVTGEHLNEVDFGLPTEPILDRLTVLRPTGVFDPQSRELTPTVPSDLAAWLEAHPNLKTTVVGPVTIGGASGIQLNVTLISSEPASASQCKPSLQCYRLFSATPQEFVLVLGNLNTLDVLSFKGTTIVISIEATPGTFDDFTQKANQLLSTLQFQS
jgi:hypothetical protein